MYDEDYGASIVRWGGDYKVSPPDAMHFEIANGVTPAMASRVAERIARKYVETTEGDDMKATDPVRLGPANAETLGQSDHVMTYEETVAVNTAASVRTNQLLSTLITEIQGLRRDIGGSK
jgi:hypothetical protein